MPDFQGQQKFFISYYFSLLYAKIFVMSGFFLLVLTNATDVQKFSKMNTWLVSSSITYLKWTLYYLCFVFGIRTKPYKLIVMVYVLQRAVKCAIRWKIQWEENLSEIICVLLYFIDIHCSRLRYQIVCTCKIYLMSGIIYQNITFQSRACTCKYYLVSGNINLLSLSG